jgi:PAS domain S-box-containing protein
MSQGRDKGLSMLPNELKQRPAGPDELNSIIKALQESEERFRATFNQAAIGIAHVALDGKWLLVNQKLCDILGYRYEELIKLTFADITHPSDLTIDLEYINQMLAGDLQTYSIEKRYIHRDRSIVWINLTVSLLHESTGEPKYFISFIEDISARKAAEEKLHHYAENLEEQINSRTKELKESNAELEAFANTIAHDLRAPLRAMQGFAQALIEDYSDLLDSTGQEYAQRIIGASKRMDVLIHDLLNYSRLSRADIHIQPVRLDSVLESALSSLKPEIEACKAQIFVEHPLKIVLAHYLILNQVITCLLSNAIKFVPEELTPQIRVWSETRDQKVRLWIEDNGIGIEAEHHSQIFKVFERLHSNERYPGTGIGLAIVKKGCEKMGGNAGVESKLGKGSRFWIDLDQIPKP